MTRIDPGLGETDDEGDWLLLGLSDALAEDETEDEGLGDRETDEETDGLTDGETLDELPARSPPSQSSPAAVLAVDDE